MLRIFAVIRALIEARHVLDSARGEPGLTTDVFAYKAFHGVARAFLQRCPVLV